MTVHHDEHLSLIAAETSRAEAEEGFLAASVDSLEVALSTEIEATNSDVLRIDGRIDSEMEVERLRIDNILSSADVDLDQFVEVVSYIDGLDLENDNIFVAYQSATDASIDSLEVALSTEIEATNSDVIRIDAALAAEEGRAIEKEGFIDDSIDSLEVALSTEIEATNAEVSSLEVALSAEIEATNTDVNGINASIDSLELAAAGDFAAVNASIDSLEVALSAEIEATNVDVDNLYSAITAEEGRAIEKEGFIDESIDSLETAVTSLETKHDTEMNAHHEEHVSLINTEVERATGAEGALAASVDSLEVALSLEIETTNTEVNGINASIDSLEVALSTEIEATNSEVIRIDGRVTSEMEVERLRIDAILSSADVDLDQFVEVVSYIDGLDLENDNIFVAYQGATDNSIDSLELALENGSGALVDSVDSLEVAVTSLETKHDSEMTVHHDEHVSLIAAEESRATAEEGFLAESVDSLEIALSTEIEATNADFLAVDASIDSLETALAGETSAREFGDTYVEATVTGIVAAAGTIPVNVPTAFAEGTFDTEVYVNGLRVEFAQDTANDFRLSLNYALEATDVVRIVGVQG